MTDPSDPYYGHARDRPEYQNKPKIGIQPAWTQGPQPSDDAIRRGYPVTTGQTSSRYKNVSFPNFSRTENSFGRPRKKYSSNESYSNGPRKSPGDHSTRKTDYGFLTGKKPKFRF